MPSEHRIAYRPCGGPRRRAHRPLTRGDAGHRAWTL